VSVRRPKYGTKPLLLPWPDPHLSPNKRHDLRALTGYRRIAHDQGWAAVNERRLSLSAVPLQISLEFHPPDRRRRDLDNLYSSFKAYQDGIFEALGLDDSLIQTVHLMRGKVCQGGAVNVLIEAAG
jgi:crossover junction endodeoxyribonuclease RusA